MAGIRNDRGAVQHVRSIPDLDRATATVEGRVRRDIVLETDDHRIAVLDLDRGINERRLLRRRRERHDRRIGVSRLEGHGILLEVRDHLPSAEQQAVLEAFAREHVPHGPSTCLAFSVHRHSTSCPHDPSGRTPPAPSPDCGLSLIIGRSLRLLDSIFRNSSILTTSLEKRIGTIPRPYRQGSCADPRRSAAHHRMNRSLPKNARTRNARNCRCGDDISPFRSSPHSRQVR